MKPSEALEAAAFVAAGGMWCQDTLALDENGCVVDPENKDACQWCALGLIANVPGADFDKTHRLIQRVVGRDVVSFNDATGRTHMEVAEALWKAAELARSKGQ